MTGSDRGPTRQLNLRVRVAAVEALDAEAARREVDRSAVARKALSIGLAVLQQEDLNGRG